MLYLLGAECPVKWTSTQEKAICQEFPWDFRAPTAEDYVTRTYLQFLWLPEVCIYDYCYFHATFLPQNAK